MDGFYQIIMQERSIPYNAVRVQSGMLWEWLVMQHRITNASAEFSMRDKYVKICTQTRTQLLRWCARPYPGNGQTEGCGSASNPRRKVLTFTHEHKLYANLNKCIFSVSEISLIVSSWVNIASGPIRKDQGDQWLDGTYRCQRTLKVPFPSGVFAQILAQLRRDDCSSLSFFLKNEKWVWSAECQSSFKVIKKSLYNR